MQRLLVASGRRVDLAGLGVDTVGLDPGDRSLTVDNRMRAGEGLCAVGDVHQAGNDGLITLVVDADTGLLVGATSAGPTGGDVLGALVVAVEGRIPVERLRHMIYAYPTFHRGIEDALRDLDEHTGPESG